MKQFQSCADTLEEALGQIPGLPGARRLLGLSLGRLDDAEGARRELELALEAEPGDEELLASLISATLQTGRPYAGAVPRGASGALGELGAASTWLLAQHRLRERRALEAARLFSAAGEQFLTVSPAETVGERITASFVGQAIGYLVADELEAAQQSYSRLARRTAFTAPALTFARQLYELASEARALPAAERREAMQPLADLVLASRLCVRFYEPLRPVAMYWEGMP